MAGIEPLLFILDQAGSREIAYDLEANEVAATIRALLAERDALQAKVEAMEKDAGRYRKLRAAWSDMDNPAHEVVIAAVAISMTESELDRALDDTPTGEKP